MDYVKLSKKVSYILRHDPMKYGIALDEEGFVPVEVLLAALNEEGRHGTVTEDDLRTVIAQSEKKRFEIVNGNIRAMYGHSFPLKIVHEECIPPETLYHGTTHKVYPLIREQGLLPMGRQYVHLSADLETALTVGKRRDHDPVILLIDTAAAMKNGIKFYCGNDKTYLADSIPPRFIRVESEEWRRWTKKQINSI